MLRLMLALVAVVIVVASLASRLSEVHAAGKKIGQPKYGDITVNAGTGMSKGSPSARSTASGKHISKGTITIRR